MNRISEREKRSAGESARPPSDQRILSMSLDGKTASSIEAALRKHIDDLAQAIRDKNVDQIMSFYAHDVLVFDVLPPLETRGADAYRKNFERWFTTIAGPLNFEFKDLRIVSGDGAAFCHYLSHVRGTRPDDRKVDYWVRGTSCFEQRDGKWLITHEHVSIPMPM